MHLVLCTSYLWCSTNPMPVLVHSVTLKTLKIPVVVVSARALRDLGWARAVPTKVAESRNCKIRQ